MTRLDVSFMLQKFFQWYRVPVAFYEYEPTFGFSNPGIRKHLNFEMGANAPYFSRFELKNCFIISI